MVNGLALFVLSIQLLVVYSQITNCTYDLDEEPPFMFLKWQMTSGEEQSFNFYKRTQSITMAKRTDAGTEVLRYQYGPSRHVGHWSFDTGRKMAMFYCKDITTLINNALNDDNVVAIKIGTHMAKGHTIPILITKHDSVTFKFKDIHEESQIVKFDENTPEAHAKVIIDRTTFTFTKRVSPDGKITIIEWIYGGDASETTGVLRQHILNNLARPVTIQIGQHILQAGTIGPRESPLKITFNGRVATFKFPDVNGTPQTVTFDRSDSGSKTIIIGPTTYTFMLTKGTGANIFWEYDGDKIISFLTKIQRRINDNLGGSKKIQIGECILQNEGALPKLKKRGTLSRPPPPIKPPPIKPPPIKPPPPGRRTAPYEIVTAPHGMQPRRERTAAVIFKDCKPFHTSSTEELNSICYTKCKGLKSVTQTWDGMGPIYCSHFGRTFVGFDEAADCEEDQKKAICKTERERVGGRLSSDAPCMISEDGGDETKICKTECITALTLTLTLAGSHNVCHDKYNRPENDKQVCHQFVNIKGGATHVIDYYWECGEHQYCKKYENHNSQCDKRGSTKKVYCRKDLIGTEKDTVKCSDFTYIYDGKVFKRIYSENIPKICADNDWSPSTGWTSSDMFFIACSKQEDHLFRKRTKRKKKGSARAAEEAHEEYEVLLADLYYDEQVEVARQEKVERLLNIKKTELERLARSSYYY
eukprot:32402_1